MKPSENEDETWPQEIEEEPFFDTPRPVMFAMLADPRQSKFALPKDGIHERLIDEIFDPNPLRSHVITLHLYVEYWLDRILTTLKNPDVNQMTFHKKASYLKDKGVLDADLFANILAINRLRNVYAHELDLEKANKKVADILLGLKIDPYFISTDSDRFRSVCVQTMMLLESTLANGCKPPRLQAFPHEEARNKLLGTGQLFWQECEIIGKEERGYITTYQLLCPLCLEGSIEREKDNTPGFKESTMWLCKVCGLSGDGSTLKLETANQEYRNRTRERDDESA